MTELKEKLKFYIQQHPELSPTQIKEEISRQLKGEIFPGEVDEIYAAVIYKTCNSTPSYTYNS